MENRFSRQTISEVNENAFLSPNTYYESGDKERGNFEEDKTVDSTYLNNLLDKHGTTENKKKKNRKQREKRRRALSKDSDQAIPKSKRNLYLEGFELEQQISESMKYSSKNLLMIPSQNKQNFHSNSLILMENQRSRGSLDYQDDKDHENMMEKEKIQNYSIGVSKNKINQIKEIGKSRKSQFGEIDQEEQNSKLGKSQQSLGSKNQSKSDIERRKSHSKDKKSTQKQKQKQEQYGQDSYQNSDMEDLNDDQSRQQEETDLQNSGKFNYLDQNGEPIYSFRSSKLEETRKNSSKKEQDYAKRLKQSLLLQKKKNQVSKINQQDKEQDQNKRKKKRNNKADHPNYNIGISESKIQQMLGRIKNRIMVSCIVIEPIDFELDSQCMNQQQIDNRVKVQTQNKRSLIELIGQSRRAWRSPGKSLIKWDREKPQDTIQGKDIWRQVQNLRKQLRS